MKGPPADSTSETCSAGAGSLLLEFGLLSRLTGDPQYEIAAHNALVKVWKLKSPLGLLGNSFDATTGSVRA